MRQLINHTSEVSAYAFDYFPYCFGEFSKIRYWVESNKTYGQRFCYRVFDPHRNTWAKPKDSKYTHLVFMFQKPNGMVLEQCINLTLLSVADMHHIIGNYIVTQQQKEILQMFIASAHIPMRTVWRDPNDLNPDVLILEYDPEQPSKRSAPVAVTGWPTDNVVVTSDGDEIAHLRKKLHDKEALDIPAERRAFYYEMQNRPNPDDYTAQQVRALS